MTDLAARNTATVVKTSRWLEMLEPAPEPQLAQNGRSSLQPAPEPQNARKVLLKPGPQPHARWPLEPARLAPGSSRRSWPALEQQHARKVPLETTAVRCVRFLRSKWPLEKCCPLFVFYRHHLLLGSTLLRACYARVHTSIYIIYIFLILFRCQFSLSTHYL